MTMGIVMLIVSAAAAFGGYRQSQIARAIGKKGVANLWLVIAGFCALIAVLQLIGLFTG